MAHHLLVVPQVAHTTKYDASQVHYSHYTLTDQRRGAKAQGLLISRLRATTRAACLQSESGESGPHPRQVWRQYGPSLSGDAMPSADQRDLKPSRLALRQSPGILKVKPFWHKG
jgi:hypothetical protein